MSTSASDHTVARATRYLATDLIGCGGMAEVYRGQDMTLHRPVAIKRLRPELATNPTLRVRFSNEAKAVAGLRHPAIVAVYDAGADYDPATGRSVPFLIMELVEGSSLREVIAQHGGLDAVTALQTTAAVLDALVCSHAAGIVHRDIKPGNVLLTRSGQVKVTDFGIARSIIDPAATATQTGVVMGTPQYMSPEQVRGNAVDLRSDVYSVGCLLYEALTGRPPFLGDSPVSFAYQHVATRPTPPSTHNPTIGADVDAVVLKALAKKPTERYQSAETMRAAVHTLLLRRSSGGTGSTAAQQQRFTPIQGRPRPRPPGSTRRVTAWVATALLVTVTATLLRTDHQPDTVAAHTAQVASVQRSLQGRPVSSRSAAIPNDLIGERLSIVVERLQAAGFRHLVTRRHDSADHAKPGVVTAVDPSPGRRVLLDQAITISYTPDHLAKVQILQRPATARSKPQPARSKTQPPPSRGATSLPSSAPRSDRPDHSRNHGHAKQKPPKRHKSS